MGLEVTKRTLNKLRARAGKDRPGRAGANAAHGYLLLHTPEHHSLRIVLRDEDGAHGAISVMPDTDDQVRVVAWPDGAVGEEIRPQTCPTAGAVAAGAPRHSAWGARRGGPVSGARRPRAGR